MARIHPFRARRPDPQQAPDVASLPYDVVSAEEARGLAEGKPHSFLHVIRPEIDLPEGTPFDDDRVYRQGAENLQDLFENGVLRRDTDRAVYLYRLVRGGRPQTGVFTCVSVDEYDRDLIRKHELTRPDKEDDRTRHILTQSAHAEPVMLTFKPKDKVGKLMEEAQRERDPLYDFEAEDGVRHTLWKITDTAPWEEAFGEVPLLYIADGHHRCKSASRAAAELEKGGAGEEGEHRFFPAVLFPMDQMEILPYNRLVYKVPADFRETLEKRYRVEPSEHPAPGGKGSVCLYHRGTWLRLELPLDEDPGPVQRLDVYRLQKHVLEPMLDISDPRRDTNITFVGGIRGTDELQRRVDDGEADLAVSMYPTAIEELVAVADAGELMPPKSTWFEPKLRSGLLVHTF
ncbi:MAG: DUF1015 family protein [Balneolaceae bacterium]|nr:DUF1015 family protein [Balneolaceae bacterium]